LVEGKRYVSLPCAEASALDRSQSEDGQGHKMVEEGFQDTKNSVSGVAWPATPAAWWGRGTPGAVGGDAGWGVSAGN